MQIEWSTAVVQDGSLTVELSEDAPEGWGERVTAVLERLGRADGVSVEERCLVVDGVEPGGEGDLRHLLDSAVLQASADLAPDEDEDGGDDGPSEADREMTEAFREE